VPKNETRVILNIL